MPHKKDFAIAAAISAAVGVLAQPLAVQFSSEPTFAIRAALFVMVASAPFFFLTLGVYLQGRREGLFQFFKFATVGTLNFFIDIGVLNMLMLASGITAGVGFAVFKAVTHILASTNSFFWNKYWTFGSDKAPRVKELATFYAVGLVGSAINVGIASAIVNGVSRPSFITPILWANIAAIIAVKGAFLWNFFGYRNMVFKKRPIAHRAA